MLPATVLIAALSGAVLVPEARAPRVPIDETTAGTTATVSRRASPPAFDAIGNVRVNDPSQLPGPAGDVTPAIAVNGDQVLVVWRVLGALPTQRLRAAYSEDGGATFTDAGWLPALPGAWRWGADPCVEADPVDGTFMVLAQVVDPALQATAVALITAQIGGGLNWGFSGFPYVTGYVGAYYGDQLDVNFDATNRTLHVAFHDGYVIPSRTIHRYSADHGATWFAPDTLVTDAAGADGVAPRVAFRGSFGPLVSYVGGLSWQPATMKSSAFWWPGFLPPVSVSSFLASEMSLPGTLGDRAGGHSLAVDRTLQRYASRAYLAWVRSAELNPWPTPAAGSRTETEPNDTPAQATAVGAADGHLVGLMTSDADVDVYAVPLQAQQHLVIVPQAIDSAGANPNLRFEILAPDGVHGLGYSVVPNYAVGPSRLLFTAPRAATFFVRVTGYHASTYQLAVATSTLTSYPAADRRDIVTSVSTDAGATWSAPAPVFTGLPGFDAALVKAVVGNDGRPYLFWLDFGAADADGALATLRTTRSNDGGVTWEAPRTLSSVASDWQSVSVTSGAFKTGYRLDAATTPIPLFESPQDAAAAPPHRAAAASPEEVLHVAWADARDGEGNIYTAHFPTGFEVLYVTNDTVATPGQWLGLRMVLQNRNTVFPTQVTSEFLACQRNWPSISGSFSLDPGTTSSLYPVVVQVPDTAAAGTVFYQAAITLGPASYGINTFIHVQPSAGVGAPAGRPLSLAAPGPNPASAGTNLRFDLPAASDVSLALYDVRGARVRTLQTGPLPGGSHARAWDLADDAGRRVPPGLYLARLAVGDASLVRRLVVVR